MSIIASFAYLTAFGAAEKVDDANVLSVFVGSFLFKTDLVTAATDAFSVLGLFEDEPTV